MRKRIRIILLILSSGFVLYMLISFILKITHFAVSGPGSKIYMSEIEYEMKEQDSIEFKTSILSQMKLFYHTYYSGIGSFASYKINPDRILMIRSFKNSMMDLNSNFRIVKVSRKNLRDTYHRYNVEPGSVFNYSICVDRVHKPNVDFTLYGEDVKVIQRTKDTLHVYGNFYAFAFGKKDFYTNEGMFLKNETFWADPVSVDLFLINNKEGLTGYFYYSSTSSAQIPQGSVLTLLR